MKNRYDNLLLGANSLRFSGAMLKLLGFVLGVALPIVAAMASLTESADHGLVADLNNKTAWWPLIVALLAMPVGVQFYVRGITQASYGEAFLALADIAVATAASAPAEKIAGWQHERGLGSFVLQLAAFGLAMVLIPTLAGVASSKADEKVRSEKNCHQCASDFQDCSSGRPSSECEATFASCRRDADLSSYDCRIPMASPSSSLLGGKKEDALAKGDAGPLRIQPGAAVEFLVTYTDAVWDDESSVAPLFGDNAGRKHFRKGTNSTPGGGPLTVLAVHGKFFATADAPLSYAPISAAKVAEPSKTVGESP